MLKKHVFNIAVLYSTVLLIVSLIKINTGTPPVENSDKIVHFVAHFLLTILWFLTFTYRFNTKKNKALLQAFVFSLCFGIIVEVLQDYLTTTRQADINDIFANISGAILGLVTIVLLYKKQIKI